MLRFQIVALSMLVLADTCCATASPLAAFEAAGECREEEEASLLQHGYHKAAKASGKYYLIESVNAPGKYLNVDGAGDYNGADIHLWDDPQNPATQWYVHEVAPNIYNIESVNAPGKFMNVDGAKEYNGADIHLWNDPHTEATRWKFHKVPSNIGGGPNIYNIENVNAPGKFLNVDGEATHKGANVHLWDNPWNNATRWRVRAVQKAPPTGLRP